WRCAAPGWWPWSLSIDMRAARSGQWLGQEGLEPVPIGCQLRQFGPHATHDLDERRDPRGRLGTREKPDVVAEREVAHARPHLGDESWDDLVRRAGVERVAHHVA